MPEQDSHHASICFQLSEGAFQPSAGLIPNAVCRVSKALQLHLSPVNLMD